MKRFYKFLSVMVILTLFVGLDNYKRLFSDEIFITAMKNTFIILIIQVPLMLFLALVLATLLNSALLKLKGLFRVTFFLPAVTSLVAYSIIYFYHAYGRWRN
ncbi:hypothetical protein [Tepidibacillus marianensis]|uniref:hypothetical protein n=1 Tax=Tepidibacillus marianensis TaxID=3131995 RepID=UPI0030CBFC30